MNRPAVEAGLSILEAGGDFADGIMAYGGNWLGGETFVSFDKQTVELITGQGQAAQLLPDVLALKLAMDHLPVSQSTWKSGTLDV